MVFVIHVISKLAQVKSVPALRAQSDSRPTGDKEVAGSSLPGLAPFFRED